ncbi:chemotaxis protein CheD [Bacillus coahuilensis m2-6]|uniref:Chemoreceptor glutamine deamidase CheD n=1 Tax=Bacillus coahuilensis p1.1.43 TaxID=1150625 RepID=A0A147K9N7_9BACI|nr:chemotaxis protein CheD [Bacillus coahuilensis]KUP07130.1 chemotaxis protein CheD [Bacillus coahuilensis p1.1.43]KUP08685.1 chemotaxis protein CheD [Bacillus coahuilensis m2-6]
MLLAKEIVKVGIADLNIAKYPYSIRTSGLGSCVGVVIYDEISKIAGLAHVMLPESSINNSATLNEAKFADTALKKLKNLLIQSGCSSYRLKAKIAGGAQMFSFSPQSDVMRIGPRNVEAVKEELSSLNIPIISEDVGGNKGRTIEFDPDTTLLHIRTVNQGMTSI